MVLKSLLEMKSGRCHLLFLRVEWVRKGGDIAFETLLKLKELGMQVELVVSGCAPPETHPILPNLSI